MDITDKVALVTGGASGLGTATAKALALAGAKVIVADIDEDAGRAVAAEVGGYFVASDVSSLEANHRIVAFATEQEGGLDIAFLNAGVATGCGVGDDFDLPLYRRAMGANIDGVIFGIHAVLPAMKARGGGAIVATASLAALAAPPFDPIYTANKSAVVGLTRSLGPILAPDRVRINAICPGFAESKIVGPIRDLIAGMGLPLIAAEKVADTVITILSGDGTGDCWFIQPGRESGPFSFRKAPGPRFDPD